MKHYCLNLKLTSVIVLIAAGVLLPVMLSTAVGIVTLVIANDVGSIVVGVLVISFAAAAGGCALIAVVLTGKKARLARLQADFVANITHELRTPLSSIRLYTQTLQTGRLANDPQQIEHCLAAILRETEWLDMMIDKVLTWRASSRDMLPLKIVLRPVSPAVKHAITRFKSIIASEDVEFTDSINTALPVPHDPGALTSIVMNLLTNAYKYTGRDKRISINVRDTESEVLIEVCDNGCGLTPGEIKHIFKPFYRVPQQGNSTTSGTGLGLAIAQYLADRHKGAITIDSEKDRGSTFTLHLPVKQENA